MVWCRRNFCCKQLARVIFSVESVDITLGKPDTLSCLSDVVLDCILPIDNVTEHDWSLSATNGVLQGDYTFHMTVVDMDTGAQVHTTTAGPSNSRSKREDYGHLHTMERLDGRSQVQHQLPRNLARRQFLR